MIMKYLKVWTSFRDVILPLLDDEKGRLFDMMLQYADDGVEPSDFIGNERFIWPAAKQQIDFMIAENNRLSENGKKGGRPKTNKNQTEPTITNKNQTEPNKSQKEKKINEMKMNETKTNEMFDRFWSVYPRHVAKQNARKEFDKANVDETLLQTMLTAIEKSKRSEQWTKDNGQYIPHPSTWIHQRRWEDDLPATKVKVLPAQDFIQRDYSDVNNQMLNDLEREMAEFQKGAG